MATTVISTLAATTGVADHEQGLAAGVRQTTFQLGIAVGVAALIPIASSHATSPNDLAEGIRTAFLVLATIVGVAGVVACVGMGRLAAQR